MAEKKKDFEKENFKKENIRSFRQKIFGRKWKNYLFVDEKAEACALEQGCQRSRSSL